MINGAERFYSAADLWRLSHSPENSEKRLELSNGVLLEMPLNGGKHGVITFNIAIYIYNFVKSNDLGIITAAGTGYILHNAINGRDTVRAPDAAFVSNARLEPFGIVDGYAPFAPDLAVEVVSPNDQAEEIAVKVEEYLRYGTRLVWVLYPKTRTVFVHRPDSVQKLKESDTLDGEDVLPGFSISVRDIFG